MSFEKKHAIKTVLIHSFWTCVFIFIIFESDVADVGRNAAVTNLHVIEINLILLLSLALRHKIVTKEDPSKSPLGNLLSCRRAGALLAARFPDH